MSTIPNNPQIGPIGFSYSGNGQTWRVPAGYLVWGTGSGSPTDPDWFQNLRQVRQATVEIGTQPQQVLPRELTGQERERVWREVVLAAAPEVVKYERRAGRVIPVAVLVPQPPS